MTGGCLPMVVQMVILMGIISVIYSPADPPGPYSRAGYQRERRSRHPAHRQERQGRGRA